MFAESNLADQVVSGARKVGPNYMPPAGKRETTPLDILAADVRNGINTLVVSGHPVPAIAALKTLAAESVCPRGDANWKMALAAAVGNDSSPVSAAAIVTANADEKWKYIPAVKVAEMIYCAVARTGKDGNCDGQISTASDSTCKPVNAEALRPLVRVLTTDLVDQVADKLQNAGYKAAEIVFRLRREEHGARPGGGLSLLSALGPASHLPKHINCGP